MERHSESDNHYPEPGLLPSDLAALYGNAAHHDGRNETLFRLACLGRDNGLCQGQVVEALAEKHACQPATGAHKHKKETYHQRYREATRSIQSAFKYRSRTRTHTYQEPDQLPNVVREALLDRKWTFAIRTIEALRLKSIQPGQQFTKKQAVELLKGIVGQGSIYNALNAMITTETALFESSAGPLPRTPSPPGYAVAKKQHQQAFSKCLEKRMTKPLRREKPHRVAITFTMPGNRELARKLGVRQSNICDELTEADLEGAKTARTALHAGLLKRKPGQYTIGFLANRLGLSPRSIQRYNSEDDHIHCQPIFREQAVYWHNLEAILPPEPDYFPHEGVFLVDTGGKRYPPRREIARNLLSQKQQVILKQQVASYWWYGDPQAPMPVRCQADMQAILEKMAAKTTDRYRSGWIPQTKYSSAIPVGQGANRQVIQLSSRQNQPVPMSGSKTIPQRSPTVESETIKRPLNDLIDEAFAQHVYQTINAMSEDKEGQISIFSARRLVVHYGESAVHQSLEIAARKRNVRKPVGYVSTLLRSEKRARGCP